VPEIGGGCIMAHIHAAEAFAPVTALQGRVLTVTAAFTAVAIVLSLATAGWVARPLRRLADRTRELQAGDFGSPVPVEGPAEVRTLARTFAGMAHSLQEALAQEREARAEAETGRQRAALLAEASRAYAEAGPGAQRVLDAVAHLVATVVGDACTIFLVTPDGATLEPVAAYDQDPAALALLKELIASRPWGVGEGMAGRAVQTGQPVLAPEVDPAAYRALLRPEHREGFERYGAHSVLSVPLRVQGRPVGAVSLARHRPGQPYTEDDLALAQDLADRAAVVLERARLFEAEREARQAAEAAVGLRDEFLSVAAHELKTPMTGLRLAVQHLLRRLDRGVAPEPGPLRQALGAVEQQSAKASRLVAQLLETSRLEAGRLALDRRVENLSALVAGVVEQARARTSRHDVVLSAPPEVRASVDALRLEQVLTNLLDNALKFSPAGGQIDVEVSAPDTSTVRLAVRDRGLGIPPEHRGRIFERFHQAHAREHRSGLGIGLYMSRGIVELHGGQMWAEFPPDGGTRFVVTLPTGLHAAPSRPEQEAMA
jgi:signal transduction histidine kinase